jgi:hypothetical protein
MTDKETNTVLNIFFSGIIISFIVGLILGVSICHSTWKEECLNKNVGYYDSFTGQFKLKDLNIKTNQ